MYKQSFWGIVASVLFLLNACGSVSIKPQPQPQPQPTISASIVSFNNQQALKREIAHKARIGRLIAQAEAALLNGRLTSPENDNAYDRFAAVLMLDSENNYAINGLRRILLAYVARVHQALAAGKLRKAKLMTQRAEQYFPGNPLVNGLKEAYAKAEHAQERDQTHRVDHDETTIRLPVGELSDRSDSVKSMLTEVALRVRESDEGVMIYARTDAEGRWIYKTMKQAAEGYRIRGDIRIHRKPAIVFIEPLVEDDSLNP